MKFPLVGGVLLLLFPYELSWAARGGVVESEQADVHETPDSTSRVLEKLKKGDSVVASNLPTEAFQKVRTLNGTVGWMLTESLILNPPPSSEEVAAAVSPDDAKEANSEKSPAVDPKLLQKRKNEKDFRISALGDVGFFNSPNLINNLSSIGMGFTYGGEIALRVAHHVYFVLRAEMLSKTLALTDSGSGKNFQVKVGALPILGGLQFSVFRGPALSFNLSILAGMAIQTQIQSTDLTDLSTSSGATVAYLTNNFSFLGKVETEWKMTRHFSVFLEAGYRYLRSPQLSLVSPVPLGALVLQPVFGLDLGGPLAGGGISFLF